MNKENLYFFNKYSKTLKDINYENNVNFFLNRMIRKTFNF